MSDIRPTDDHPEGGLYVSEHGFWINAEGEFVDAHGNPSKTPVKANQPKPDSRPNTDKPAPPKPAEPQTFAKPTEK